MSKVAKLVDDARRIEQFAVEFMLEIWAGESSGNAKRNASEKTQMGTDDKELALRIFFDLKNLPNADGEWMWKGIVANWLLMHPRFREHYPKLPSTLDLIGPPRP